MSREARLNRDENRFEISFDEGTATLDFRKVEDDVLDFESTVVPEDARGQGIAGDLVRQALEWARENELRVVPSCPFVERWIDGHEEFRDMVAVRPAHA